MKAFFSGRCARWYLFFGRWPFFAAFRNAIHERLRSTTSKTFRGDAWGCKKWVVELSPDQGVNENSADIFVVRLRWRRTSSFTSRSGRMYFRTIFISVEKCIEVTVVHVRAILCNVNRPINRSLLFICFHFYWLFNVPIAHLCRYRTVDLPRHTSNGPFMRITNVMDLGVWKSTSKTRIT